ncbi:Uu.00g111500.m01.CDS01 [Anthostomella pinea]|uniref:Uu.00g111500.m01.CDS01 n=1 Tax=Anthostomella pinea TaxID=933095 RepID=A0AAI8V9Y7_9PEZI|nr:Uu.00g111500.m01.CDS01 [Anthostomella pinea]
MEAKPAVMLSPLFDPRLMCKFKESLAYLMSARQSIEQHKDLIFAGDLRDLVYDFADVVRDLDEPVSAEQYLRKETGWQDSNRQGFDLDQK